jgi:hypothetical protein
MVQASLENEQRHNPKEYIEHEIKRKMPASQKTKIKMERADQEILYADRRKNMGGKWVERGPLRRETHGECGLVDCNEDK